VNVLVFQGYVDPEGRRGEALLEAWPTLAGVAGAVARAGCAVQVVVAARRDEKVETDGVLYRFVAERVLPSPRRLLGHRAAPHPARSLRAVAALRPDVVHLHGLSFPRQARTLRRLNPKAALLAQDHADRPPVGWRRRLHRWGYEGVDGAAFTAPELAFPFVRAGILPDGVQVFGVLEGSSRFTPGDRDAARRELGLEGNPLVAWVGNLTGGKDPATALEAFRHALEELPGATLCMAYRGGDLEEEIRARVSRDPALASRVRLLGPLPHPRVETLLRGSDALLAPSRREGSGYALIEALACGTPAVASSIPSHRAILGAGRAGVVAPMGDAAAMGRGLAHVVRGGAGAREAARRRFEEGLTFDRIGVQLHDAYRAMLASRARGAATAGEVP
jgi:glycosyltransferase involved in cell wall biosynthesis